MGSKNSKTGEHHVEPPWDREGGGIHTNDSGHLFFFILILSASEGVGSFNRNFTTNLARECRAFRRALKLKS